MVVEKHIVDGLVSEDIFVVNIRDIRHISLIINDIDIGNGIANEYDVMGFAVPHYAYAHVGKCVGL